MFFLLIKSLIFIPPLFPRLINLFIQKIEEISRNRWTLIRTFPRNWFRHQIYWFHIVNFRLFLSSFINFSEASCTWLKSFLVNFFWRGKIYVGLVNILRAFFAFIINFLLFSSIIHLFLQIQYLFTFDLLNWKIIQFEKVFSSWMVLLPNSFISFFYHTFHFCMDISSVFGHIMSRQFNINASIIKAQSRFKVWI